MNRQFWRMYGAYCDAVKDPTEVLDKSADRIAWDTECEPDSRPATKSDTFYHAVFSSVSCAEYWNKHRDTDNGDNKEGFAFLVAARNGSLLVLHWARKKLFSWGWDTICAATLKDHLDALKWAYAVGCP